MMNNPTMVQELFLVMIVCVLGVTGVALLLRLFYGKTLTVRLWVIISPGICCLCVDVYLWALLGGPKSLLMTFVLAPIGVIIMVINFLYMGRAVISRLLNVLAILKDIAEGEGDLTRRIPVSHQDEIGQLATYFNLFIDKIQSVIKTISANAYNLNTASHDLSQLSGNMSDGAGAMAGNSRMVTVSAEEMSSNLIAVSAAMEQSSTNVSGMATAIEEMTSTINEIAKNSENARNITANAVSQANMVSDKIRNLGNAAQDINKVTESITDISDKTNLLSLNATIEAARAGEAGKGFAIVASEIKELAGQTVIATHEIKNRINEIQDSTSTTIPEIQGIVSIINTINEIVEAIAASTEEQSITAKEISQNASLIATGITAVTENVARSSRLSENIAKDIVGVDSSAKDMTISSSDVNTNANELAKLAVKLNDLVGKFKI
jgi:methyl-accepting chemotaxis protein